MQTSQPNLPEGNTGKKSYTPTKKSFTPKKKSNTSKKKSDSTEKNADTINEDDLLTKNTDEYREYELPHGWKKIGQKRPHESSR